MCHRELARQGRAPSIGRMSIKIQDIIGITEYKKILDSKGPGFSRQQIQDVIDTFRIEKSLQKTYDSLKRRGLRVTMRADGLARILKRVITKREYNDLYSIGRGDWVNPRIKFSKKDMQDLARRVGILRTGYPGIFLSEEVKGMNVKYKWGCTKCERVFYSTAAHVYYDKSWCHCSHLGEQSFVHELFNHLFRVDFISEATPDWLKSSKGGQMRLDGDAVLSFFGESFEFAWEYDEDQHFNRHLKFDPTEEDFEWSLELYRQKNALCEDNNVMLMRVPYILFPTRIDDYYDDPTISMQSKIIDIFLILIRRKYEGDGLSENIISRRIEMIKEELESRPIFTLDDYIELQSLRYRASLSNLDRFLGLE